MIIRSIGNCPDSGRIRSFLIDLLCAVIVFVVPLSLLVL